MFLKPSLLLSLCIFDPLWIEKGELKSPTTNMLLSAFLLFLGSFALLISRWSYSWPSILAADSTLCPHEGLALSGEIS
jgi:hypothetical protein